MVIAESLLKQRQVRPITGTRQPADVIMCVVIVAFGEVVVDDAALDVSSRSRHAEAVLLLLQKHVLVLTCV